MTGSCEVTRASRRSLEHPYWYLRHYGENAGESVTDSFFPL